jgi:hypothetical protein
MAATAAASVAAVSGLAAYLNGKYHLGQDLEALIFRRKALKYYQEIGKYTMILPHIARSRLTWYNSQNKATIPMVLICSSGSQTTSGSLYMVPHQDVHMATSPRPRCPMGALLHRSGRQARRHGSNLSHELCRFLGHLAGSILYGRCASSP